MLFVDTEKIDCARKTSASYFIEELIILLEIYFHRKVLMVWGKRGRISPWEALGQKKGEGWALCSAPPCCLTSSYEPGVQGDASTHA